LTERGKHVVTSTIEHPAVMVALAALETKGYSISRVPVDVQGRISPASLLEALRPDTILIATHLVNHELGTVQLVQAIGEMALERKIPFFLDGSSAGSWLPLDVRWPGVTMLSVTPARFHGPKGTAILYKKHAHPLCPQIHGGVQEQGFRAGSENIPGIVGASEACRCAQSTWPERVPRIRELQQRLLEGLRAQIPELHLLGPEPGPERSPNHLHITMSAIEGEGLVLMADLQGIAVATGPACLSRALKVSHVMKAIGLPHALCSGNLLFTLGAVTTDGEIDHALATLPRLVQKLRDMSPLWSQ
jgi:cysteine desulfurase